MTAARDHTELDCWNLAEELWRRVRVLMARPQFRNEPSLVDQLGRSAAGPGPQIAEGFSRFHPKEFAPFLRIAKGSLSETISHLARARALGLITDEECAETQRFARRARGATTQLLLYLESDKANRFERRPRRRRDRWREPRHPEPRNPEPLNPEPLNPEPRHPERRNPEAKGAEPRNPGTGTPEP